MSFADDLLKLYVTHFNDNESDSLELFVRSVLDQMDYKDILEVFDSLEKEEINEMLGSYLSTSIENKLKGTSLNDYQALLNWKDAQ